MTCSKSTSNWAQALDIAADVNGTSPSCQAVEGSPAGRSDGRHPGAVAIDVQGRHLGLRGREGGSGSPPAAGTSTSAAARRRETSSTGFCSISGASCILTDPNACTSSAATLGEVCVPACSALGGIYRSSPTLVGVPNQYLRDDAYQAFAAAHATRRQTMYVASMDGVLHAFKALATNSFDADNFEMWAFVPPAVLPKIASNYPSGQQILLDGTPVVKDTVWDRAPSDTVGPNQFHTTLVAGMGAGGPGYYALNVTDPDCDGPGVAASAAIRTRARVGSPRRTARRPPTRRTVRTSCGS